MDKLRVLIRNETVSNITEYLPAVDENSQNILMKGLYDYIERKMYDSTYGDMVPDVTANALDVNIIIVEKRGYGYICYCTGENADMSTQLPLLVFKSGKHYDGLIHVNSSNRGFSNDVNVNLMTGTPECPESASIYSIEECRFIDTLTDRELSDPRGAGISTEMINSQPRDVTGKTCNYCENDNTEGPGRYTPGVKGKLKIHGQHCIKLVLWNINGLTEDKLSEDIVGKFLKQFDLILLTETWTNEKGAFELEGLTFCNYPMKNKHLNAKRDSGGLGVFIRDSIKNGVVLGKNRHDVIGWLTLKSDYFGFKNDLHVANIYIVPQGSVHMRDDVFALLYEDVAHIPSHANVLLCGDYNAHRNTLSDYEIENRVGSDGNLVNLLKTCLNHVTTFASCIRPGDLSDIQKIPDLLIHKA